MNVGSVSSSPISSSVTVVNTPFGVIRFLPAMFVPPSTISANQEYRGYNEGKVKTVKWKVVIKGGANLAGKNLITPKGVLTTVTDEEMGLLETDPLCKRHVDRGCITVKKKKIDVEDVVKNMEKKDNSAPKVAEDFKDAPIVNKGE